MPSRGVRCFNPRPAARPGESRAHHLNRGLLQFQSTPGRSAGRINFPGSTMPQKLLFQSTPGRSAGRIRFSVKIAADGLQVSIHARPLGRANRMLYSSSSSWYRVSIHARPLGRANRIGATLSFFAFLFQSTPGRSAGRIRLKPGGAVVVIMFQSTPGRSAGRIASARFEADLARVSIHARPLGRANRPSLAPSSNRRRFQSTPGRSAGRITMVFHVWKTVCEVSIHARPLGRANRHVLRLGFQRFKVSIHARPLGRANREGFGAPNLWRSVSIHARPLGRANHNAIPAEMSLSLFQSTPGRSAGRIPTAHRGTQDV
uniref:Uncharacterized protein n=1 Tax=mine drainage metagenome TaxID=410659 RepID=E6PG37_9ZZZZ